MRCSRGWRNEWGLAIPASKAMTIIDPMSIKEVKVMATIKEGKTIFQRRE